MLHTHSSAAPNFAGMPAAPLDLRTLLDRYRSALLASHGASEAKAILRAVCAGLIGVRLPELEPEKLLSTAQAEQMQQVFGRIVAGEPVQYALGFVEFHGLRIAVDPRVLIPRPETEELVDLIIRSCSKAPARIVDVGTGSGCIALALKKAFPAAQVFGLDISAGALELAAENARANHLEVQWSNTDALGEALPQWMRSMLNGPGNLLVSNPPYVPLSDSNTMQAQVFGHEPHLALFVDNADPQQFFRAIAHAAAPALHPGDSVWFEGHYRHALESVRVVKQTGIPHAELIADLSGNPRFIHAWM